MSVFLAKSLVRCPLDNNLNLYSPNQILENLGNDYDTTIPVIMEANVCKIPTWPALNSIMSLKLPVTRIATPPLIAAPAHEFKTLLTVLKQVQGINVQIMGLYCKTIISVDLGLYKPAKQLQMSRQDLNDIHHSTRRTSHYDGSIAYNWGVY